MTIATYKVIRKQSVVASDVGQEGKKGTNSMKGE